MQEYFNLHDISGGFKFVIRLLEAEPADKFVCVCDNKRAS